MSDLLNASEVAEELNISRQAATKLMKKTKGVIELPPINGTGQRVTRRMPRAVLEQLKVPRSRRGRPPQR